MATRSQNRQALLQRRALDGVAFKYERRLAAEIRRATLAAARKILSGETIAVETVRAEHKARVQSLLESMYVEAGETISAVMPSFKSRNVQKKEFSTVPNATMAAANFARIYSSLKITQISNTTIDDVQAAIAEGVAAGRTEKEIAQIVRAFAPIKSASRAQTIARTETAAASSYVAQSIAEMAGVEMVRVWVSVAESERSRQAHLDVDGQERGMFEPFDVDGEQLMYPADPNGSAHNVINCRCQVVYQPK